VRASSIWKRARYAAGAAAIVTLLAPAAALGGDPGSLRPEAERLRAENAGLATRSQEVLLDLYALESRLARVQARLAGLERRAAAAEAAQEAAQSQLRIARAGLAEAERRLATRLQTLYVEGDVDPLAVLLGAESLEEALTALDGLGRFAADDQSIATQVRASRQATESRLRRLAARRAELRGLVAEATATRSALVDAQAERSAYLAGLRGRMALNSDRIVGLARQAVAAEGEAAASTGDERPTPAPAPAPPPEPAPPPDSGSRMIVHSTGYCLRGTTSTGIPTSWGVVAVDPAVIPLGTRMFIPGYGDGVAADTGPAVRGAMIDLWFPSCPQALAWGTRTVTITIY
jgi:3D (Asp-Asp-Asp) domain-containing protein/peptidoglycan hydrolase CwlO-like protein